MDEELTEAERAALEALRQEIARELEGCEDVPDPKLDRWFARLRRRFSEEFSEVQQARLALCRDRLDDVFDRFVDDCRARGVGCSVALDNATRRARELLEDYQP